MERVLFACGIGVWLTVVLPISVLFGLLAHEPGGKDHKRPSKRPSKRLRLPKDTSGRALNDATSRSRRDSPATLPRHIPSDNSDSSQRRPATTLESLPTELILSIGDYLPAATRAALALTSKEMLGKMGTATLSLRGEDRFALLALFEREGRYPSMFLCSSCLSFHRPRFSGLQLPSPSPSPSPSDVLILIDFQSPPADTFSSGQPRRNCDQVLSRTDCDISFGAAAAVLRSARLGNDIYPPSLLSSRKTYRAPSKRQWMDSRCAPAVVTRSVEARVHGTRLLVRTEWVFDAGVARDLAPEVAGPALSRVVKKWPTLAHACAHTKWSHYYPDFLHEKLGGTSGLRYRCLWSHRGLCRGPSCGWESLERSPGAWGPKACMDCFTEFEYMRRDVRVEGPEKEHRTLVLIVWQDLGEGRRADDPVWAARLGQKRISRDLLAPRYIRKNFESCGSKP